MGLPPRPSRTGSPDLQPAAPLHSEKAVAPIEPIEARRKPNGRDLTMLQLREGVCRWPSDGDKPPYTDRGRPVAEIGGSWCEKHRRKVCQ